MSKEEKTIKNLITAANICAVISLFVFGAYLSALALGLAFVARRRANELCSSDGAKSELVTQLFVRSRKAFVLCAIVLVVNLITSLFLMPMLMEQYGYLLNGTTGSASVSAGSSVWG